MRQGIVYRTARINGMNATQTYWTRVIRGARVIPPFDQVRYVPVALTNVAVGTTGFVFDGLVLDKSKI